MKRRSFITLAAILSANAQGGWSQPLVKPIKEKWSLSIGAFGDMDTHIPILDEEEMIKLMGNDINLMNLCLTPNDSNLETLTDVGIRQEDLENLSKTGFTIASLANEAVSSGTKLGRSKIGDTILQSGMTPIGLENQPYQIFNIRGKTVSVISASVYPGVFQADESFLSLLKILKKKSDIVITTLNIGGPGKKFRHVINETEFYLGKPRGNPVEIAQKTVNAGADLVLITGAGTPKGMHIYKNRLIAYGLGQLRPTKEKGLYTLAPGLKIRLDKNGILEYGEIISFLNHETQITKDDRQEAMKIIQMLSKSDFSETTLKFEKTMFSQNHVIE